MFGIGERRIKLSKKDKKEPNFRFELGSRVRDTITGFEGILTHRSQWLHNCNTYGVKPTELKDGVPQKSEHFDEPQLELVEKKVVKESDPKIKTGGPERPVLQTNR